MQPQQRATRAARGPRSGPVPRPGDWDLSGPGGDHQCEGTVILPSRHFQIAEIDSGVVGTEAVDLELGVDRRPPPKAVFPKDGFVYLDFGSIQPHRAISDIA